MPAVKQGCNFGLQRGVKLWGDEFAFRRADLLTDLGFGDRDKVRGWFAIARDDDFLLCAAFQRLKLHWGEVMRQRTGPVTLAI
ncbi:MAG: hypothetical protein KGS44_11580 [Alphaproteobacteria bacterium]|nr:hypothetical protein [Alphaproteobacteria bacterium]